MMAMRFPASMLPPFPFDSNESSQARAPLANHGMID
jgi:hypothetical protein